MNNELVPIELISIATSFSNKSGYCIILKEIGGVRKLQMIVGTSEAQALAVYLEKIITIRPLTHHFLSSILNEFEVELNKVVIYDYNEGIYYCKAYLQDSFGNEKEVDCRPSDAICLALKMNKPIFANLEIFDSTNQKFIEKTMEEKKTIPMGLQDMSMKDLNKLLSKAIEDENFERAEEIKKEIDSRK